MNEAYDAAIARRDSEGARPSTDGSPAMSGGLGGAGAHQPEGEDDDDESLDFDQLRDQEEEEAFEKFQKVPFYFTVDAAIKAKRGSTRSLEWSARMVRQRPLQCG